jgi:hypothetical protein
VDRSGKKLKRKYCGMKEMGDILPIDPYTVASMRGGGGVAVTVVDASRVTTHLS